MKNMKRKNMRMLLFVVLMTLFIGSVQAQEAGDNTIDSQNKIYLILGCALAVCVAGVSSAIGLA
ncbi:MAG: hypothetical protein QXS02_06405, partial [Candidatus Thermoplasmatota archaeon]